FAPEIDVEDGQVKMFAVGQRNGLPGGADGDDVVAFLLKKNRKDLTNALLIVEHQEPRAHAMVLLVPAQIASAGIGGRRPKLRSSLEFRVRGYHALTFALLLTRFMTSSQTLPAACGRPSAFAAAAICASFFEPSNCSM